MCFFLNNYCNSFRSSCGEPFRNFSFNLLWNSVKVFFQEFLFFSRIEIFNSRRRFSSKFSSDKLFRNFMRNSSDSFFRYSIDNSFRDSLTNMCGYFRNIFLFKQIISQFFLGFSSVILQEFFLRFRCESFWELLQ